MSSTKVDKMSKKTLKTVATVATITPTSIDNRIVKGLGKFRVVLRKLANILRSRGYMIVLALSIVLSMGGCSTIVKFDSWLPEWV